MLSYTERFHCCYILVVLKCCMIVSSHTSFLIKCADEKPEGIDDANNTVDRIISRTDMATQMSPEGSSHSSCKGSSSSLLL